MNTNELIAKLEKTLLYTPKVYKQSSLVSQENFDNEFILEYSYSEIQSDALLFFVPSVSSKELNKECVLNIRTPYADSEGKTRYLNNKYKIYVEQVNASTLQKATKGDILANRLCIFRFNPVSKIAILINSPLYNDVKFSSIEATDAVFLNDPYVVNEKGVKVRLVNEEEFSSLVQRVNNLEQRILFGSEDPNQILKDKPVGTIYIQYEETK